MRFQPEMTGLCLTLALMLPGCGGDTDGVSNVAPLAPADANVPAAAVVAVSGAVPDIPPSSLSPSEDAEATALQPAVPAQDAELQPAALPTQEAELQAAALAQDAELQRFVTAQDHVGPSSRTSVYEQAVVELGNGKKTSHWMWYVFPQLLLGTTEISKTYAIADLDQARRYLAHPVLGERLRTCFEMVLKHSDKSAAQMFGGDAMKLMSSATLFQQAGAGSEDPKDACFQKVLDNFYAGKADQRTLDLLQAQQQRPA